MENFDPNQLDMRWYATSKEDRLDLLYDLVKQVFRKITELEDEMNEQQQKVLDAISNLQTSQDENFKKLKETIPILELLKIRTRLQKNILASLNSGFNLTGTNVEQALVALNELDEALKQWT
ncbi:MAG TPA: hypothetical protein PK079_12340 [Leptospiraceae bacterium]|nr:hypothetical protein [Leptospiraceae bacterium]HMW05869.1 hypothetical protein [Leptospiraceae bacterium]HMX33207.1 hypothetical protein [Leptospiraceae bacterium]HMY33655.1 hypothetical protein [Leptospiraceae bacterium]HMZ64095.1 hypothetical protein [Leptospiraceae bacterium]